ncbi:MAG: hypothetical protein E4H41_09325 [Gemmatimonadales bacterium]|nr:MAG: hypothetical protein E4H41_09325 [Gemmatimonadales bacterium]
MHRNFLRAFFVVVSVGILNCTTPTDEQEFRTVSLTVSPVNQSTTVGGTVSYTATATLGGGETVDATDDVIWTSGSPLVATMGGRVATGVGVGVSVITATDGEISGTTTLTVIDPPASIAITPVDHTAEVTDNVSYTATATSTTGATSDVTATVTWGSTAPAVATIAAGGMATALSAGMTNITAALGAVSDTTSLMVTNPPPPPSVTVMPADTATIVGDSMPYTAVDEMGMDITGTVVWSSTNPAVAAAPSSPDFKALAGSPGQTKIVATLGALSDSATLTVTAMPPTGTLTGFAAGALGAFAFDFACWDPGTSAFTGPVTQWTVSGTIFQIWYMPAVDLVVVHTNVGFETFKPGTGCALTREVATPVAVSARLGDVSIRPGFATGGFGDLFNNDRVSFYDFGPTGAATALADLDITGFSDSGRVNTLAWVDDPGNPPKLIGQTGNGLVKFVAVGSGIAGSGGPFTVNPDNVTGQPQTTRWVTVPAPGGFLVALGSEARTFRIPANQPVPVGAAAVPAYSPRNLEFNNTDRCMFGFPGIAAGASYQAYMFNSSLEITSSFSSLSITTLAQVYSFATFPDENRTFAFGRINGGMLTAMTLDIDLDCRVTQVGAGLNLTAAGTPGPGLEQLEARAAFKMH